MLPFSNCRRFLIAEAFTSAYCKIMVRHDAKIGKIKARGLIPDAYSSLDDY